MLSAVHGVLSLICGGRNGGLVLGGTVLTGKAYSATLACDEKQIEGLRESHGTELEFWWSDCFGFGYECLTRSEARYLLNTPTAERIRDRITAVRESGDSSDYH